MKRICVFCGSSTGQSSAYVEAAQDLGRLLAESGYGLVYGGGNVGLMGTVATAAADAGTEVIGVIPTALQNREPGKVDPSEVFVVNTMHERKMMMATLSDGFIAMAGGIGTLEEIFEIVTWSQLGFHDKPCILLNTNGYYDKLNEFLDHLVEEGFVQAHMRDLFLVADTPEDMITMLDNYEPIKVNKWLEEKDI